MEPIINLLLGIITGGAGMAFISWLRFRKKDRADVALVDASAAKEAAETAKMTQQAEQSLTEWYREQVEELTKEMRLLKIDFKDFRESAEKEREQYQRQAVTLFNKIDTMGADLIRANLQLEAANKTIGELREEVKGGNAVIAELREQVTQLLVKLAEKKE